MQVLVQVLLHRQGCRLASKADLTRPFSATYGCMRCCGCFARTLTAHHGSVPTPGIWQVQAIVDQVLAINKSIDSGTAPHESNILVFLPGAFEVNKAVAIANAASPDADVFPLYSSLDPSVRDQVLASNAPPGVLRSPSVSSIMSSRSSVGSASPRSVGPDAGSGAGAGAGAGSAGGGSGRALRRKIVFSTNVAEAYVVYVAMGVL